MSTFNKEKATENLKKAIEIAGGIAQISTDLGISEQGFRHYLERGVKASHVVRICELAGWTIRPEDLRPDVFAGVDRLPGALRSMRSVDAAGKDGFEVKEEMLMIAAAAY